MTWLHGLNAIVVKNRILREEYAISFATSTLLYCNLPFTIKTSEIVHVQKEKPGPRTQDLFHGGAGEREWRSGESTGLPPMWPGLYSQTDPASYMGCVLCSKRFFSGYSGFLVLQIINLIW